MLYPLNYNTFIFLQLLFSCLSSFYNVIHAIHLGENFQADHAALLSILRNEGVSATGLGSKTYNNLVSQFWFVVIIFVMVFLLFNNSNSSQYIVRNYPCILC